MGLYDPTRIYVWQLHYRKQVLHFFSLHYFSLSVYENVRTFKKTDKEFPNLKLNLLFITVVRKRLFWPTKYRLVIDSHEGIKCIQDDFFLCTKFYGKLMNKFTSLFNFLQQ